MRSIGEGDLENDEVTSALCGVGHGVDFEIGMFVGVDYDPGFSDGQRG